MGSLLSRFRKKPTTMEQLQTIEDSLIKIEDYKRHTERSQKKAVANVLIYGAALYILACVIVFVWYLPESWLVRLGLLVPLVLVPFIIYRMKRFISKYFHNKMVRANEDYENLQKKKKNLIDNVMETETFNKAREILVKYAPERLDKKLQNPYLTPEKTVAKTSTTDLRQRNIVNVTTSTTALQNMPKPPAVLKMEINNLKQKLQNPSFEARQIPQPLFKKNRTLSEKLVDYLIGDGPENRYALICKFCNGHNGMALKEEFQFISYSCCYCLEFNASRTKRPLAPRLSTETQDVQPAQPPTETQDVQPAQPPTETQDVQPAQLQSETPDDQPPQSSQHIQSTSGEHLENLESTTQNKTEEANLTGIHIKKEEMLVSSNTRTDNTQSDKMHETKVDVACSRNELCAKPDTSFDEFMISYAGLKGIQLKKEDLLILSHRTKTDFMQEIKTSCESAVFDTNSSKSVSEHHDSEVDEKAVLDNFMRDFNKRWRETQRQKSLARNSKTNVPLKNSRSSNKSITEQHDRDDSDDSDSSDYSGDSDDDLAHVDRFTRDYRKWREPVKEKSLGLFTKVGNIFTSTPKQPAQKKRRSVRKDYKFPTPIPFDEFIRQLDNSAESAGIESIEETEQVSDRKERDQETADPEPKQPMQFVEEIRQGESQTTQTGSRPVEA
ncbi:endoplasmic reticulum junction formation protein lunapark-B isoform X2 [Homalodisca vitripennis]|uniref:endoplasmic reticulum junction formation protein lunapark-B isoform X2 n=1 Tax=Homalodisca vitripennis TaxID=197043 RepID=UPI001EEA71AA|nr:endoplasmic reticulum junction formation protein lunapark-B isoform X2 [Homalodisca vitripennis]